MNFNLYARKMAASLRNSREIPNRLKPIPNDSLNHQRKMSYELKRKPKQLKNHKMES